MRDQRENVTDNHKCAKKVETAALMNGCTTKFKMKYATHVEDSPVMKDITSKVKRTTTIEVELINATEVEIAEVVGSNTHQRQENCSREHK